MHNYEIKTYSVCLILKRINRIGLWNVLKQNISMLWWSKCFGRSRVQTFSHQCLCTFRSTRYFILTPFSLKILSCEYLIQWFDFRFKPFFSKTPAAWNNPTHFKSGQKCPKMIILHDLFYVHGRHYSIDRKQFVTTNLEINDSEVIVLTDSIEKTNSIFFKPCEAFFFCSGMKLQTKQEQKLQQHQH